MKIGPILRFLLWSMRRGALRQMHLGVVSTFGDGATLDVPGSPRVITVPGHTPGSAALFLESDKTLFVGDALATYAVTNGVTGPQVAPFAADPVQAVASLGRLENLDAQNVLPATARHGWTASVLPWRKSAAAPRKPRRKRRARRLESGRGPRSGPRSLRCRAAVRRLSQAEPGKGPVHQVGLAARRCRRPRTGRPGTRPCSRRRPRSARRSPRCRR